MLIQFDSLRFDLISICGRCSNFATFLAARLKHALVFVLLSLFSTTSSLFFSARRVHVANLIYVILSEPLVAFVFFFSCFLMARRVIDKACSSNKGNNNNNYYTQWQLKSNKAYGIYFRIQFRK